MLIFHGPPSLLGDPDVALCTSVDDRPHNGSLVGSEIDESLQRAVAKVKGEASLEEIRREWVTRHRPEGATPAFSSPPCGLSAQQIIHSLLPPLDGDIDAAQRVVMHAYRNAFEILRNKGDRYIAIPVFGADSVRQNLAVSPFVKTLFAALAAFGDHFSEVYLCPHSRETEQAIKQEIIEALRARSGEEAEQARLILDAASTSDQATSAEKPGRVGPSQTLGLFLRGPGPGAGGKAAQHQRRCRPVVVDGP